jgi:DnaJ like chaperone protein
MTIWGRIIGFFLGYKLLGILGGLIGFLVGSLFDRGLRIHLQQIPRERSAAVQNAFFTATFSIMGHLAKADGRISEDEIRVANQIMSRLELGDELRRSAIQLFTRGKEPTFNLEMALSTLFQECHKYPDLLRFFIEIQLEAALADGELRLEEKRILLLICERLNFSPKEFEQLWARQWASQSFQWFSSQYANARSDQYTGTYTNTNHRRSYSQSSSNDPTLQDAYGVLGVSPSATIAEIKKAYRRLMNQHHPDKLAARGLPEGMVKLAKEKTQQIRAAYDLIRKARSFR